MTDADADILAKLLYDHEIDALAEELYSAFLNEAENEEGSAWFLLRDNPEKSVEVEAWRRAARKSLAVMAVLLRSHDCSKTCYLTSLCRELEERAKQ